MQGFCLSISTREKGKSWKFSFHTGLQNSSSQYFLIMTLAQHKKKLFFCKGYDTTITTATPLLHSCGFGKYHTFSLCYFTLSWKEASHGPNSQADKSEGRHQQLIKAEETSIPQQFTSQNLFSVKKLLTGDKQGKPPCEYPT